MKYLKLFEDIKDFYYKIPITEFNRSRLIKFNNDEVKKIRRMIYNAELLEDIYYTSELTSYEVNYITAAVSDRFRVFKLEDEWYLVWKKNELYKCDQWDGLLKCLQDIL